MRGVRQTIGAALVIAAVAVPAHALELRCEHMMLLLDYKTGDVSLHIQVDAESAVRLGRLTKNNVGTFLRVAINGREVARPVIREPVLEGRFQINVPQEDVEMMKGLVSQYGSSPTPIIATIKARPQDE